MQPLVADQVRGFLQGKNLRGPVRPSLGIADEELGSFEAGKCSVASRGARRWWLEMGIWSAFARHMGTPFHVEIAAGDCQN